MVSNTNIKTLILEDNRQMRTLLSAILAAFGFRRIWGANTNDEAFEQCREIDFDLIIVDQKVGSTSGLDFVRKIRDQELSPYPYVPIIMISSYSERVRIMDAINAGVDEFLVKPVKPLDIARRIDAVTFKRRDFVRAPNYFGPDRRRRQDPHFRGPFKRIDDRLHADADVFEFD
ncbi:MAG: two-component system response regulator [Ponticaulis sp.]|nr:two-component system response regulator [Ponticaulis sp.]